MKIYNQTIQFPTRTAVKLIGGHPAAGTLITEGVVIDTIDDSHEPYYQCLILGNPRAVYPYTASNYRIVSQSELQKAYEENLPQLNDATIMRLFNCII